MANIRCPVSASSGMQLKASRHLLTWSLGRHFAFTGASHYEIVSRGKGPKGVVGLDTVGSERDGLDEILPLGHRARCSTADESTLANRRHWIYHSEAARVIR